MVTSFSQFVAMLKLEMKRELENQTRAQRQGDFPDNLIVPQLYWICSADDHTRIVLAVNWSLLGHMGCLE
jgi:hypothetical protein